MFSLRKNCRHLQFGCNLQIEEKIAGLRMNVILLSKPLQQLENGSKRWKNCRHWKFLHVFEIA